MFFELYNLVVQWIGVYEKNVFDMRTYSMQAEIEGNASRVLSSSYRILEANYTSIKH